MELAAQKIFSAAKTYFVFSFASREYAFWDVYSRHKEVFQIFSSFF